jgi:hypothetical protein
MAFQINMAKALDAATQALVDDVRKSHGLDPMPVGQMPPQDQTIWRHRAMKAVEAVVPFISFNLQK